MKLRNLHVNLVELPVSIEVPLFLLKEELQSYKFFDGLRNIGLDDSYYHADLSSLVLGYIGFQEESDELHDFYFSLIRKYSEEVNTDNDTVMKLALKVYMDLLTRKNMLKV